MRKAHGKTARCSADLPHGTPTFIIEPDVFDAIGLISGCFFVAGFTRIQVAYSVAARERNALFHDLNRPYPAQLMLFCCK